MNHSCNPNCRYRHKGGRVEIFARRDIAAEEELTISYRSCESSYPGLQWDVTTVRQQLLKNNYFFTCNCELCHQPKGIPGLESTLCSLNGCKGEMRPSVHANTAQCVRCGAVEPCDTVYKASTQLIQYCKVTEAVWDQIDAGKAQLDLQSTTQQLRCIKDLLAESQELLHPHHIALFRLRALFMKALMRIREMPGAVINDYEFVSTMLSLLNHMDETAVYAHTKDDIMRVPVLKLKQAVMIFNDQLLKEFGQGGGKKSAALEELEHETTAIISGYESLFCSACQMQAACSLNLLLCAGCGTRRYCSKPCQRKDWKEGQHKKACVVAKKANAAA